MKQCFFYATLLFFFLALFKVGTYAQANNMEEAFLRMKRYVVGIGVIVNDTINVNGRKVPVRKFQAIGSGFLTYSKYKTTTINNIITAAHVAKYFVDNNIDTVYIRPSWADTIKTTEYFGVRVPRFNSDKTPNIFFYPDKSVDLASILIPAMYFDTLFLRKAEQIGNVLFPYTNMTSPYIGDQVWIVGYPGHIQSEFQSKFLYNISTFKPGYIIWKPAQNMTNPDLNTITLVESNATYGNSGGPVFSFKDYLELVGILVGGYEDTGSVYLDNKPIIDSITKKPFITKSRAGVSIIVKAEYVKKMIDHVNSFILKQIEGTKK